MSDPSILALSEAYLAELTESRSVHTTRAYRGELTRFVNFFATEAEHKCTSATHLRWIDHEAISKYMDRIHGMNKSSTAARALSVISEWFMFLGRKGYVSHNPVWDMERPTIPEDLPRIPSVDKANDLCDSVSDDNSSWPARDRAILELLYDCGVLVSELVSLDVQSVHLVSKFIVVRGKGGKMLRRPLGDYAVLALREYLIERTARLRENGQDKLLSAEPLFLNISLRNLDNPSVQARLTSRSVGRIVTAIAIKRGLSSRINPRTLRIAGAAHMLNDGAELRHVQEFLEHRSADSTKRVKRIAKASLKKDINRTHPRA